MFLLSYNIMINSLTGRYRFLSNFYPSKIEHQGITYPTVEHFYVSMKIDEGQMIRTRYMTTEDCRQMISKIPTASEVKKLGASLKIRKGWDDKKLKIMEFALNEKFKNNDLRDLLISTGSEEIVEGNYWHDNFFGVCSCKSCEGKGQNNLGKLLMSIREKIIGVESTHTNLLEE